VTEGQTDRQNPSS